MLGFPRHKPGKVFLVGAGPGDPGLMTIKGKQCLESADVILYDRLIDEELLNYACSRAEVIYVGKKPGAHCADQRAIEALLIDRARAGQTLVRLKSGDPFVFGRGGEEAQALRAAGIDYEIVPGVSSAIAVPAYAGIPLTHRSCASSVAIVTGHKADGSEVKWAELARIVDTIVILMGARKLRRIMAHLLENGCEPQRPAALIESGTRTGQRTAFGTVATIADLAEMGGLGSPAVIVVGPVVGIGAELSWFKAAEEGACGPWLNDSPQGAVLIDA